MDYDSNSESDCKLPDSSEHESNSSEESSTNTSDSELDEECDQNDLASILDGEKNYVKNSVNSNDVKNVDNSENIGNGNKDMNNET